MEDISSTTAGTLEPETQSAARMSGSAGVSGFHRAPTDRPVVEEAVAGDLAVLVRPGWVHGALYTSKAIFELELERIFHRGWVFVGHESEIPAAGDFRLRRIGRQPVIFVRGGDDVVRVLLNRCRHRGAVVCENEQGRDKFFRCWYHGWTYSNTGELAAVTGPEAYGPSFDPAEHALTQPALTQSYRGFIFASLGGKVPPLEQYLGAAAAMIDLLVDAAPGREIDVSAGCNKTVYNGNWKLVGMDGYHPNYLHASVLEMWGRHAKSGEGLGATHAANPFDFDSISEARDFGHGHSMLDLRKHRMLHADKYRNLLRNIEGGPEYMATLFERDGEERAIQLLATAGDPHLGVFPNLQLINNQIRIINPIAADQTEVIMFPVLFKGVSKEINALRLRQHESFYGPAGSGSTDDTEIFERVQLGLSAQVEPWIDISRGMEREWVDDDGVIVGHVTDEVPQRGQMRQWLQMMTAADGQAN